MTRLELIQNKLSGIVLIMLAAMLTISGSGIVILYDTYISQTTTRLIDTAKSNTRMIESIIYHETKDHPSDAFSVVLKQITTAHELFSFGSTGEFTLAIKDGDQIKFLIKNRLSDRNIPAPIHWSNTDKAEPMRRALSGQSGWIIGPDYRGVDVMAAYEPVEHLNMGLVVKIDMTEIQAPFIKAGVIILILTLLLSIGAFFIFHRISNQIYDQFEDSTQQFIRLASKSTDTIYRMSIPNGIYEYVSPSCNNIFESSPEEFYRNPLLIQELMHPDWSDYFHLQWKNLVAGKMPDTYDYRIITPSGKSKWIHQNNVLVKNTSGEPIAIEGIVSDVTEQKEHLNHINQEKKKAQRYLDIVGSMIVALDNQGCITLFNQKTSQVLGYSVKEADGLNWFDNFIPEKSVDEIKEVFNQLISGKLQGVEFHENTVLTKDGQERIIAWHNSILYDKGGTISGILSSGEDITDKKKIETELLLKNLAFENSINAICISDKNLIITHINEALVSTWHFDTIDNAIGIKISALIKDKEESDHIIHALNTFGMWEGEFIALRQDGTTFNAYALATTISNNSGKIIGYQSSMIDITERKTYEKQLKHSESILKESLTGTISSVAKAIEIRDPYTAGHQQRVAQLSDAIASEMNLTPSQIEGVRLGAIIHDIGKIKLPAEILSKPGRLTELEYNLIKGHTDAGHEILSSVEFLWPIANIAYQHHERLNGSGYPQGLKSDEICIEAKIVAVADVVEAISSDRPYRPGLGIDTALEEIEKNMGILYDETASKTCLKLFREKGFTFTPV